MENDIPNPEELTDEQLDSLLSTGKLPESIEDDEKGKNKPEDKPKLDNAEDDDEEEDEVVDDDEGDAADDDDGSDEDVKPTKKPAEDETKKPSRREQARVQDLLKKYGNPAEQAEKPKAVSTGMDYDKELEADPEMIAKLKKDRETVAEASYNEGLEQMKSLQFNTRLEIDAPKVEQKYPILDKNSKKFKAEAATDFNLLYLHFAQYDTQTRRVGNPDVRYSEFADVIFGLANDLADTQVNEQVREVKKQVAKTGLRPDGSRSKKLDLNKAPEDMSDDELDAYLAKNIPKR